MSGAAAESGASPRVIAWYDRKTRSLLDKYGPGPRVHYHTGLIAPEEAAAGDLAALRRQLVASQERMLRVVAEVWDAPRTMTGPVLDVGCGLGGSAIFFAQELGATVTGITPVARHVALANRFAADAGVSERVRIRLGEAHTFVGEAPFDAAYSIGASTYFDRARWFRHLRSLVRPGGHVLLEDSFCPDPRLAAAFNAYWLADVGTPEEYVAAGQAAGFELVRLEDVSREAAGFWRVSNAFSQHILDARPSEEERAARRRSLAWFTDFYEGHLSGAALDLLLAFRRTD